MRLTTKEIKFKPIKLHLFGTILAMIMVFASCSKENSITEFQISERIDLNISGTLNNAIHLEESDLTNYASKEETIFNNNEYEFIVNLDNGATILVTLYNMYLEHPLAAYHDYDAYTKDIILDNDKPAYIIAQYINEGTEIEFSTIASNKKGIVQNGILNVQDNGSFYRVFINGLELFEAPDGSLRPINSSGAIEINGTFTINK